MELGQQPHRRAATSCGRRDASAEDPPESATLVESDLLHSEAKLGRRRLSGAAERALAGSGAEHDVAALAAKRRKVVSPRRQQQAAAAADIRLSATGAAERADDNSASERRATPTTTRNHNDAAGAWQPHRASEQPAEREQQRRVGGSDESAARPAEEYAKPAAPMIEHRAAPQQSAGVGREPSALQLDESFRRAHQQQHQQPQVASAGNQQQSPLTDNQQPPLTVNHLQQHPLQRQYPPNHPLGNTKHLCSICGDRATGKHYGVFSCEGCKGFFKRTIRKDIVYVCRAAGSCVVDMRQRNRCQHCRYQKCLRQGMRREAVQEEKQRIKLRAAAAAAAAAAPAGAPQHQALEAAHPPAHQYQTQLLYEYEHQQQAPVQYQPQEALHSFALEVLSPPASVTTTTSQSLGGLMYNPAGAIPQPPNTQRSPLGQPQTYSPEFGPAHANQGGYCSSTSSSSTISTSSGHLQPAAHQPAEFHLSRAPHRLDELTLRRVAQAQIEQLIGWAKGVPKFSELLIDDQVTLLRSHWNELIICDIAFKSIESAGEQFAHHNLLGAPVGSGAGLLRIERGLYVDEVQAQDIGLSNMFDRILRELVFKFRDMRVDANELACLRAIILFNPETHGLKTSQSIEEYRGRVYTALDAYCRQNHERQPNRFGKLLLRLPALRSIGLKCDSMRPCDRNGLTSHNSHSGFPPSATQLDSPPAPNYAIGAQGHLLASSVAVGGGASSPSGSSSSAASTSSTISGAGSSSGVSSSSGLGASSKSTGPAPATMLGYRVKLLFFDICYEASTIDSFLRASLARTN